MKTGITCLIPFYNEGQRLIQTLRVVTEVNGIDKIICIDDGSNDDSVELLKKYFPNITLIKISSNKGKTEAVRIGLESVTTPYTFLLDADLQNLNVEDIELAIQAIVENPKIDMLILQRIHESFMVKLFRFDVILSGQRIIKTKYLDSVLAQDISHYDLEVAMNEFAKIHYLKVARFPIAAVNTRRLDKWGPKQSFLTNLAMFQRFMRYPGLIRFIQQIVYFAKS